MKNKLTKEELETLTQEPVWIFPYEFIRVGESFFIPTLRPARMMYRASQCAVNANIKVKIFICSKEEHLGIRVWRIG
jgi:hypothetical protein